MVDISVFRENLDLVLKSQEIRFKPKEIVEEIVKLDKEWREAQKELEDARREFNDQSKEVGKLKKAGAPEEEVQAKLNEAKKFKESIPALQDKAKDIKAKVDKLIPEVGNLVHESVPVSNDEANNTIVRKWGVGKTQADFDFPLQHHHILLYRIGGYEPERGVKVFGRRGYFLRDMGLLLNMAIINYAIAFLRKKDFSILSTPLMMKKSVMAECCQLDDFDEQLYQVSGGIHDIEAEMKNNPGKTKQQCEEEHAEHEKYLIATSEQPISAFHKDECIDPKTLPLRYCGYSTCFRKEAGKSGHDCWGIYRVHQFEKIEQFCITTPEKSWEMQEEMINTSEEFYQSLNIPYRVVNIVSGALNNAAARKYDLEGWFPTYTPNPDYRELVSCSNCTDYQSRRLNIKNGFKPNPDPMKRYVHMLNSTLCATGRTICAILENYQTKDGIKVPEVLQPYMAGIDFIPFIRDPPKNQTHEK